MKSKGKSNTKKPHYLITATIWKESKNGELVTKTFVISESLTNFLVRNAPAQEEEFNLQFSTPISKMDYKRLRLKYNPSNESYFKLKKKDYR